MQNKPIFGQSSQRHLHFKDYLQAYKSRSKPKQEIDNTYSKRSPQPNRTLNAKQSADSSELLQLRRRYGELQCDYKQLLEKVKVRNVEHERLKEEIQMYQNMHKRDTEQIERLRCIIGLINRKTVETQVSEEELEWNQLFRNSRSNKFDQSTEDDIKIKQTKEAFYSKDKRPSNSPKARQQQSQVTLASSFNKIGKDPEQALSVESPKGVLLNYERELRNAIGSKKRLSNSPYSQLRFVPKP